MTTAEQQDFLAAGIARVINDRYYLGPYEARMLADMIGFASGSQILQQQKILRADPQAVARWVQAAPQTVNYYLF
jgi:hypothetical protein